MTSVFETSPDSVSTFQIFTNLVMVFVTVDIFMKATYLLPRLAVMM